MHAINGRPVTPTQAELLVRFTDDMNRQWAAAPAELRDEILRTFRSGVVTDASFAMVAIKLAHANALPSTADVLAKVLGTPLAASSEAAGHPTDRPVIGSLDTDAELYDALRGLNCGTPVNDVRNIASRIAVVLKDARSRLFWIRTVNQARQGAIPPALVVEALEKRHDPAVEHPARVATAHVMNFLRGRNEKLRPKREGGSR
jgi:hypothetical protein